MLQRNPQPDPKDRKLTSYLYGVEAEGVRPNRGDLGAARRAAPELQPVAPRNSSHERLYAYARVEHRPASRRR